MRWRTTVAAIAAASAPVVFLDTLPPPPCEARFDGTFVQLRPEQRALDASAWGAELRVLRDLGIRIVIVQYSTGPGDDALLAAATSLGIQVYLGLPHDPRWPHDDAVCRDAPPLADAAATRALAERCASSPACVGWYISQEVDDATWSSPGRTLALREHLARTSRSLRELAPGKHIAVAPFFTGVLAPDEYARWWGQLLEPGTIDVLALQDGVGTGRATPEVAGAYLAALRPALEPLHVELWAVAELFHQQHGVPIDDAPFAAIPIGITTLRRSLAIEGRQAARIVTFSVLDYMDPRRGGEARRLHDDYASRCRDASSTWRISC
jgi:hypothetical protein